jgi:type I restriction enzyme R subunit
MPCCSTLYLGRPMRNHTLVQTIAQANRVFSGKHSGCSPGKGGTSPVKD